MHINKDLPHKERPSPPRNECQLYTIIKTSNPSQTKVRIIYPCSGTLKLWKFSNLTFGGYLAGTIPILSTRSSLFSFRRCYLEHVRTIRLTDDFWHHHHQIYLLWVRLDTAYFAKNWKHYIKIIFKYVNSAVGPIFNEKIAEKWSLWVP